MTPRKKEKSKRKRGAQQGNKNAQKHGFYSKQYTVEETRRLSADNGETISEIILLKVMIDRLSQEISFDPKTISDSNGNSMRDDHYLRQLNTLSAMTTSQATLLRTQYLIKGKTGDLQTAILTALEELRLEMGL